MNVSAWVLSIAGVSVLSILIDLFLPNGETNSHIKTVFNYVIIFVIIAPLPSLIKSDFDTSSIFTESEIVLQEDYIYQLNRDKLTMLETSMEKELDDRGLKYVDISISADIFTTVMKIETIYVDFSSLVIVGDEEHIDIENEAVDVITSFVNIEKENIVFSGY